MLIFGLDPGETTGWCLVRSDARGISLVGGGQSPLSVILQRALHPGKARAWSGDTCEFNLQTEDIDKEFVEKPDLIIYETFRLYQHKALAQIGSQFLTVEVIGVAKYLAAYHGIPIIDSPAANKQFFAVNNYDKLKNNDLIPDFVGSRFHDNRHCLDSLCHVLSYLHFKKGVPYEFELQPHTDSTTQASD
jgi:hypothetical protein